MANPYDFTTGFLTARKIKADQEEAKGLKEIRGVLAEIQLQEADNKKRAQTLAEKQYKDKRKDRKARYELLRKANPDLNLPDLYNDDDDDDDDKKPVLRPLPESNNKQKNTGVQNSLTNQASLGAVTAIPIFSQSNTATSTVPVDTGMESRSLDSQGSNTDEPSEPFGLNAATLRARIDAQGFREGGIATNNVNARQANTSVISLIKDNAIVMISGYADGSPGAVPRRAIRSSTGANENARSELVLPTKIDVSDADEKTVVAALSKKTNGFKNMKNMFTALSAFDFIDERATSKDVAEMALTFKKMQSEGLFSAVNEVLHGDPKTALKLYKEYGEDNGRAIASFEKVPYSEPIAGTKARDTYEVVKVNYRDGKDYLIINPRKLLIDATTVANAVTTDALRKDKIRDDVRIAESNRTQQQSINESKRQSLDNRRDALISSTMDRKASTYLQSEKIVSGEHEDSLKSVLDENVIKSSREMFSRNVEGAAGLFERNLEINPQGTVPNVRLYIQALRHLQNRPKPTGNLPLGTNEDRRQMQSWLNQFDTNPNGSLKVYRFDQGDHIRLKNGVFIDKSYLISGNN